MVHQMSPAKPCEAAGETVQPRMPEDFITEEESFAMVQTLLFVSVCPLTDVDDITVTLILIILGGKPNLA